MSNNECENRESETGERYVIRDGRKWARVKLLAVELAEDWPHRVASAEVEWGERNLEVRVYRRRGGSLFVELPDYNDGLCFVELDASSTDLAALEKAILAAYEGAERNAY